MATYYADIGIASRPGSAGTQADPFGAAQVRAIVTAPAANNTFYLRGTWVLAADLTFGGGWAQTFEAWDLTAYGPWRIYGDGLYDVSAYAGVGHPFNDGILVVERVQLYTLNRMYVDLNDATSRLYDNATDTTFVYRTAFALAGVGPATYNRCVWYSVNGDTVSSGGAGATVSNGLMNVANFAAFDGGDANTVDGGGNQYDWTMFAQDYDEPDPAEFNIGQYHGVGYLNAWAHTGNVYVNIHADYDGTARQTGTSTHPLDWDAYNDIAIDAAAWQDTHLFYGQRTLAADWQPSGLWQPGFGAYYTTLDGWDGTPQANAAPWRIDANGHIFGMSANSGDHYVCRRFVHTALDIRFEHIGYAQGATRFENCYFATVGDGTTRNGDIDANQGIFEFNGCTCKWTTWTFRVWVGDDLYRFTDCVFDNTVFAENEFGVSTYYVEFRRCRFLGKTQRQVAAGLSSCAEVTFVDCVFDDTLLRDLPSTLAGVTRSTLLYSTFGLPNRKAESFGTYDFGFDGNEREGVGAFWFGICAAEASANPESGKGPLEVQFTGNSESAITGYAWDFGDGHTSNEQSPDHTYDEPGTYEVVYTISDAIGNTSSTTLTVYVYNWDYGLGYVVTKTDRCFRWALPQEPAQGVGWAFYEGADWPQALGKVGTCEAINTSDERVPLVMDANTFEIHELGKKNQWIDGESAYTGSEIESEILFPEVTPPVGAAAKLKHNQSHLNLKPWLKEYRGATGYSEEGFKGVFSSDVFWRVSGSPSDRAVSKQTPFRGQIVADRHFESRFVQMGARIRGAPWRLSSAEMWLETIDTAAAPVRKLMSEMSWALELSEPVLWVSRSQLNPVRNRAAGMTLGGTYASVVTGPDGLAWSATVMGIADNLRAADIVIGTSDFTFVVWLRSPSVPIELYNDGILVIILKMDGEGYYLKWEDGANELRINLEQDYGNWTQLALQRQAGNVVAYENGVLTNSGSLVSPVISYGDDIVLFNGVVSFFDCRIVLRAVTEAALLYMYNDVVDNQGNATCPIF